MICDNHCNFFVTLKKVILRHKFTELYDFIVNLLYFIQLYLYLTLPALPGVHSPGYPSRYHYRQWIIQRKITRILIFHCTTKFKDNKVNALESINARPTSLMIDIIREDLFTYDNFIDRKRWIAFFHCHEGTCYIVHDDLFKLQVKRN